MEEYAVFKVILLAKKDYITANEYELMNASYEIAAKIEKLLTDLDANYKQFSIEFDEGF